MGQVSELVFTDQAIRHSPVQLRQRLLESVARLTVASSGAHAQEVGRILGDEAFARGMAGSVDPELAERAGVSDVPEPEVSSQEQPTDRGHYEPASAAEVMEWAHQFDAEDTPVSTDMNETMSDVEGWHPDLLGSINPDTFQYELEQEIAQLSSQAAALGPAMERIRAEYSTKYLTLTVNGGGALMDITFRPAFKNITSEQASKDFAEAYAQATDEALAQTQGLLAQLASAQDDPTSALISRSRDEAQERMSRFEQQD